MTITTHNSSIWFTGDITETNVHYIIQELEKIDSPTLFLCSNGGIVQQGFLLFDYLQYRSQNKPVNIVGAANVSSAATYALFTDNPTFFYPHSLCLIHPISTSVDPSLETNNFIALAGKVEMLRDEVSKIYTRRGLTDTRWQSQSVYYTANDLIKLGIGRLWSNPVISIGVKSEN